MLRLERLVWLGVVLGLGLSGVAWAAKTAKNSPPPQASATPVPDLADKQSDLHDLRHRIESLRKDLASSEGHRSQAADKLRESERQISDLQRDLHQLGNQRGKLQNTLSELAQQAQELESTSLVQQRQLEKLLRHQTMQGNPDTLQLLLNGGDPNQVARDLYYVSLIGKSRANLLEDMRATLARKKQVAADTQERADELAEVESQQKRQHAALSQQREQRKQVLAEISDKVSAQRKEMTNLQENERRMTQLIERLSKILAEKAAKAAQAEKERAARAAQAQRQREQEAARESSRETPREARRPESAPPKAAEPENRHEPEATRGHFAALKGSLRLPTRGAVAGKFGAARDGGGTWKGLFIRAAQGSEVKAVAGGRVVFAEWMRGFGNLLIIDHGDAYLTIYGNNDSLLRQVGDSVRGGETVATVGNSGGNPESGLYFELRHQGQPLDPMKWASLK